jgi:DNA excision repair protein ERCC-6
MESALVICPATMLSHWLKELAIWAPGLRRVLIHKSGEGDGRSRIVSTKLLKSLDKWLRRARADRVNEVIDEDDFQVYDEDTFCGTGYVVVTTYENIRRVPDVWTNHNWTYAIMDEGQKIRNPEADVTLACKKLRTPHRLLLSGTPIQNDLKELWSLFDFVMPGRLGILGVFEKEFSDPIKRAGYSNASPMQVQLGYRCALTLRDMINPYLLRRRKSEVNEVSRMPGKTEQVLFCRLSPRQRSIYEAYLRSDEVVNILRGSPQLLRSITTLRKICNHPDLVCEPDQASFESFVRNGHNREMKSESDDSSSEIDADTLGESLIQRAGKLEVLAKILPLWKKQGHRVLIFCQWKKMLSIIEGFTRLQGWKFGRMDGNTSVAARQRLVDTFNEDESYFGLLLTTRTGGVGLNLTGADRIILYDPDWNPQTDAQARERAWRFGQKNAVTVYRLITAGTIEEKIYQRQIFKTALTNKVLQDPRQRRLFSQRDLKDFFTLKADDGSIIQGGQGTTETGELTNGGGVVDTDDAFAEAGQAPDDDVKDNSETLETVLKSKGLAGVFDHDYVEQNGQKKSSSVLDMEEKAKRVAQEAVRALRESTAGTDRFQPTWTGSEQTDNRRFGFSNSRYAGGIGRAAGLKSESRFGGAGSAGIVRSHLSEGGSAGLLAGLLGKNKLEASDPFEDNARKKYAALIKRIQHFVQRFAPTTEEILKEFESGDCDPAVFRRLLKSVAAMEGGKWKAKTIYR